MGLRTTWGLLRFLPSESWQKEMTPVTSEGPVRTHTALRGAMAMGLGLGCGSDGQRSGCERRNKRVWTPRRIAGSWLIYSCIHQRETVYNRRRERDEEEREAPREPALKCSQDEHYRQVTDWQDYCKIYHYHTALSGPGITWIFTFERFWARHYKKEEKGEIDVDNQRIKSLQKSHFEEVAGWQTTVGTRIYPIRTFLCGPGITSIYPHRDSDDNTWKSFCKRTIWEGDR